MITRRRLMWLSGLLFALGLGCLAQAQVPMTGAGKGAPGGAPLVPPSTALFGWWYGQQSYTETSGTPTILITGDGTPIGSWKDISGNGNHLYSTTSAPTYKINVLNGLPAGLFNGILDALTQSSTGPTGNSFSIYVVTNRTGASHLQGLIGNDDGGLSPRYLIQDDGSDNLQIYNGSFGAAYAMSSTTFHLVAASIDNTGAFPVVLQIDNGSVVSTNVTGGGNLGHVRVGGFFNRFWGGNIVEVLFYTSVQVFGSGDGLIARQYLNNKYSLGLPI